MKAHRWIVAAAVCANVAVALPAMAQSLDAAMGIAITSNWIANFITTTTFLTLIDSIGKSATFWLYGIIIGPIDIAAIPANSSLRFIELYPFLQVLQQEMGELGASTVPT